MNRPAISIDSICTNHRLIDGGAAPARSEVSPCCGHTVQFYSDDAFLVNSVAEFFGNGLKQGERVVLIATAPHRKGIEARLRELGLGQALLNGRYTACDAAETLSRFMIDGHPDPERFRATIRPLLNGYSGQIRAFGEMVALLWAQGNGEAVIQLEQLWNDLAKRCDFSLLCAYPLSGFGAAADGRAMEEICREHSAVLPEETFGLGQTADEQLRTIALLQQKAAVLSQEVAYRKTAESDACAERVKLEVAASVAGLGIWELDLRNKAFSCSAQCKAHFGVQPNEEISYERVLRIIHVEDRERIKRSLEGASASSKDFTAEYRVIHANGHLRWISSMGRCFRNGEYRILGVTVDVTDRNRTAELLEQAVTERTARLEEAVAELEAFSYSISHDMRAPLRSIQGYARILMEDWLEKLDPQAADCLERITAAVERMDRLIQEVLTFSRVSRTELKLEPVNLDHLVRGIVECYPNMQPPQAEIVIERTLPTVLGNAAALTQCLSNLLGNAVKFVAPGVEPKVWVWAEIIDPPEGRGSGAVNQTGRIVRLCIRDNGIGIATQSHDVIFGIFQRLSKKYEGTGIGLAIVKKAVERMGGRVGLTSEPGKGSTFWLELKHSPETEA